MVHLPQIVYLQTMTACNGHCGYCPFDDVYEGEPVKRMTRTVYKAIIEWLKSQDYQGRIGFLLHYEPTLDTRLGEWRAYAREELPGVSLEVATNGIIDSPVLKQFDRVDCVPAGSLQNATSRAGNCKATPETTQGKRLLEPPCTLPIHTMCIAVNGDASLCCQDWRHESIVGTYRDLTAARNSQLHYAEKVKSQELEICQDCISGKTAEEIGDRLGVRSLS
jgi:hypothetical protein